MYFFSTTKAIPAKMNWGGITVLLLLLAGGATAFAQSTTRAAGDLFSPPGVDASSAGVDVSEAPYLLNNEAVSSTIVSGPSTSPVDLPSETATVAPASPPTESSGDDIYVYGSASDTGPLWENAGWAPIEESVASCPSGSNMLSTDSGYCGGPVDGPVQFVYAETPSTCCGGACAGCSGCGAGNCSSLCGCGPRTWGRFDVLLWNVNGYGTPPLITRAPQSTVTTNAGVIGGDGTQILFGSRNRGNDLRIGGRLQYGTWLDKCRRIGIQTDFFGVGGDTQSTTFASDGNNIFARPFFNTNPNVNGQDAQVFAMPGLAEGSVRFDRSSEIFSAGPALRFNFCCCDGGPCTSRSRRVDFLLGYRFFRLEEGLTAQENLRVTDPAFAEGTEFQLNDSIRTRNDFHGVEFGVNHLAQNGRWLWDITAVCALGEVERVVDLDGSTRIVMPGFQDNTFDGGFFVGPGDIGRFRDSDFAAIPQIRANASYCLGRNWYVSAGYSFLYLSSAFRPGQFLNTEFDGARLGQNVAVDETRRPSFRRDDMFLHGANVGLTHNF